MTETIRSTPQPVYDAIPAAQAVAAAPDFLAIAFGRKPKKPHAIAEKLTLAQLAYSIGALQPKKDYETQSSIIRRGFNSQQFYDLILDAARPVWISAYQHHAPDFDFSGLIEVPDFLPKDGSSFDGRIPLEEYGEGQELRNSVIGMTRQTVQMQLKSYAKTFVIPEEWIFANDLRSIVDAFQALGQGAAALTMQLLTNALNNPPMLTNSKSWLNGDNTISGKGGLTFENLARMMQHLRNMAPPDTEVKMPFNNRGKYLVVGAVQELWAKSLIHTNGLAEEMHVCVLPDLGTQCLLFADPEAVPAISRLKLINTEVPFHVSMARKFEIDAIAATSYSDQGTACISEYGVVQLAAV